MAERQNSTNSGDDFDFENVNGFEFNPSEWMVLDDDNDGGGDDDDDNNVDDSLLEEENQEAVSSDDKCGDPQTTESANASASTKQQDDTSFVHTPRTSSSCDKSSKEEKDLELEKTKSPENKRSRRTSSRVQSAKNNASEGKGNKIGPADKKNVSGASVVKSVPTSPTQSKIKLPTPKESSDKLPATSSNKIEANKSRPAVADKGNSQSVGVATATKEPTSKSPTKEKSKVATKRKNSVNSKTSPSSVPSKVSKSEASTSLNKLVKDDCSKESSLTKSEATTSHNKLVKDDDNKGSSLTKAEKAIISHNKLVKDDDSKGSSLTKAEKATTSHNKLVKDDDSKGSSLTKSSSQATTTTPPSRKDSKVETAAAVAPSKVSTHKSESSKAEVANPQTGSARIFSSPSSAKDLADSTKKKEDVKSSPKPNDSKNRNVSISEVSTSVPASKSGFKKNIKDSTKSQVEEGSIAEAMGVIVSETKTSNIASDEKVLGASTPETDQSENRKSESDPNNISKPDLKTTNTVIRNVVKEGVKPKSSNSTNNTPTPSVTKKRIVRRFHRSTQTVVPQVSNKLLQCLVKIPSLDCPKKSCVEKGLQTESSDGSCVNFSTGAVCVKPDTVNQDIFQEVMNFGKDETVTRKLTGAALKYGIRIGKLLSSDVDKANFLLKKADGYTISFSSKDCGFLDLFFGEEEDFVNAINLIRKNRFGPRHVCVSVVMPGKKEVRKEKVDVPPLSATIIFDQNFASTGYLTHSKSPAWNKPKADVFVSVHNVPEGIPLSFLNIIFPDAISIDMDDPQLTVSKERGRVKLGMARKTVDQFLTLFAQVLVNSTPLILTSGLTREEDVPEMKEYVIEKKKRKEQLKDQGPSKTLKGVPRDINLNKKGAKKAEEEPDIIMQVDDVESIDKVLSGRPNAWKGPATPERLLQHKGKVQNRRSRSSVPETKNEELSDISDNSDFGEETPKKKTIVAGFPEARNSPDVLNKWRHTEPLTVSRFDYSIDRQNIDRQNQRNPPKRDSHMNDWRPEGKADERVVDRSFDRKSSPQRDSRRKETLWPDRQRTVLSRERDNIVGRDKSFHPGERGRGGSEDHRSIERDSQKSGNRGSDRHSDAISKGDKKWPDLNDADFDRSHKVIVPGRKVIGRADSEEGDLRFMLDNLKGQKHRPEDNRQKRRRSPSPFEPRRSREVQRRERSRSPMRSRSPIRPDRDRRVVRKSLSPVRRRPGRRRSLDSPERIVRKESSPPRKPGITAKDLELKSNKDVIVEKDAKKWKAKWEGHPEAQMPSGMDKIKEMTKPGEKRKADGTENSDITMSKTLFNTLMNRLKEKAEVYEQSNDSNLVDAAKIYSQINHLAETLTAFKNEEDSSKHHGGSSRDKSSSTVSISLDHLARHTSEDLLNYFKPGKSSQSSAASAQARSSNQPHVSNDKLAEDLHPDLLRYVKAGKKSSSPPPIPPPVAPPLFTSSSPSDKKAQLEAIAKQLATEILQNPESPNIVTGGTWMVPPNEERQNIPPPSTSQGPPNSMGMPTSQPVACLPHNPMVAMRPGVPPMNTQSLPSPSFFSLPPPPIIPGTPPVSSPMMPPNMWNPPPQFPPHGGNNMCQPF